MYKGSSLDFFNPKLVINRIDFDRDDDVRYQCMAQNSEGWGSSLSDIRIDVKGSMSFYIYQTSITHYNQWKMLSVSYMISIMRKN